MNQPEAAQILAILASAYPGWDLKDEAIAVWVELLADLDGQRCAQVVRVMVATETGWPTIAAIRRLYAEHAGLTAPTPGDAWVEALANDERLRNEYDPKPSEFEPWSHPAIGQAVAAVGGLWAISEDRDSTTLHAQFRRAYEDYAERSDQAAVLTLEPPPKALMPASNEVGQRVYYR